jgi:bifunctional UDP-N-acetylglucosamine pyrophosphorylase/glucosamine-1-phosphate N-acetyltransferase
VSQQYQILILAAGKGTRFRSVLPKVLHKICGNSLLERVIRSAANSQFAVGKKIKVTVVKGSGAEAVEAELQSLSAKYPGLEIKSVLQAEQRGTGDAVKAAIGELSNERVLILPGDAPLLTAESINEIISKDKGAALSVISCEPPSPFGYGRIVKDASNNFLKIVEEKDASNEEKKIREINSSLYLGDVEFIQSALASLKPNNSQGEFYFTDCVAFGVTNAKKVDAILIDNWLDLAGANTRAELSNLEAHARYRINLKVMEGGATLENPQNTFIDEEVEVGSDVYLGSGTRLYGRTKILNNAKLDGDTLIVDSTIGEGTHVKFGSMIEVSEVGPGCAIGPFAHLRPKSKLAKDVHIGNFVETKASIIGVGSKANHLSYIGDSEVGSGVNIGAGTITCNYDGISKHKTTILDRASIGSNSSLVAPVTIGEGAYVGAGSVITKDVPADALAYGNRQTVVPGWAKERSLKVERKK